MTDEEKEIIRDLINEIDVLEIIANNLSIELETSETSQGNTRITAKLKLAGRHVFDSTISSDYVDINLD